MIRIITNIEVAQDKKAFQNFDIDGEIKNKMDAIVEEALIQEGVAVEIIQSKHIELELSFSMVTEDCIRRINEEFRNVDKVTDVLSFPQYEDIDAVRTEIKKTMQNGWSNENVNEASCTFKAPIFIGDVIICYDVIKKQAEEFGHSLEREFLYLFTHSVCHLLGHDHMEEEEKIHMRKKEESIMNVIDVSRKL